MSVDRLLTSTEAARILGIPEALLLAWNSRGYGPVPSRGGCGRRWRPEDVESWAERLNRTAAATRPAPQASTAGPRP